MNYHTLSRILFSYASLLLLILILILLILYTSSSISQVFVSISEHIRISIIEEKPDAAFSLPFTIVKIISIVIASYLIFITYSIVATVATYKSYEIAARNYPYKKYDPVDILFRSISWNFYRITYILSPVFSILITMGLLLALSIILFNVILNFAGYSISFVTFTSSFIWISLILGLVFSTGMSFWNTLTTLFGIECAISEPDLENFAIRKRARKVAFAKKINLSLYIFYLIYIISILSQFFSLILFPDIIKENNSGMILSFIIFDILFFIGLGYLKTSLYIDSVLHLYNRITFKDRESLIGIIPDL